MKANSNSNIGNFTVEVEVDADAQVLANLGARWLVQRQSSIDKVLGGFRKNAKGKSERIAGWKRTDVDYSPEMATKLQTALGKLAMPDSEEELDATAVVTEYLREAVEKKYADAKRFIAAAESSAEGLAVWAKRKYGFEGETHGEDEEYAVELVKAVDEAFQKFKASFAE